MSENWEGPERRRSPHADPVRRVLIAATVVFVLQLAFNVFAFARLEGDDDRLRQADSAITQVVDRIETERADRAVAVSGVIDLFCHVNNSQDGTLASLLRVSLETGGDREPRNAAERQAIRAFTRSAAELEKPLPCELLVLRFEEGEPVPERLLPSDAGE
jgi:hypothetical protein